MEKHMESIISNLSELVEKTCKSKNAYGMWADHIKPMIPLGVELAEKYGGDKEIITIAILLHDIATIEDRKSSYDHHLIGAERAEEILSKFNYPKDRVERVKECILNHRSSVSSSKSSIEEVCVADADAIVHLMGIGSLFYTAYMHMGKSMDEGQKWVKEKLEKDYVKLSEKSKEEYSNEFRTVIKILDTENKNVT
jgi:uncharacterized protein